MLLEVKGLRASVGGKEILKGIDLAVDAGEVHAIMGPNASGKSTLAQVLAGRESFQVTGGGATLDGRDLLSLSPEDRARAGLFLAFQYPVEIPGVSNATFLRAAVNAVRKERGEAPLDPVDFLREAKRLVASLAMDPSFLERPLNAGFSGGEKKRNEVLQMAMLAPRFAILDETDSGLDIDALRVVSQGINSLRSPERGMLVVTHYQRLLDYVVPDRVHVLAGGRIVTSGGPELAKTLEERGYGWVAPGATGSAASPAGAGAR
jgi:Fe-S cluster assembly ATP-binding protein